MVKHTIQIFARIRPTKKATPVYAVDDDAEKAGSSLEFVVPRDLADGFVNNKKESYKFRFRKVFDQDAKQEDIFEHIAKPVADNVLAGYNGTIFAYGQTGSGKTFTITGGAESYSDRGIIPRILSYLYEQFSQDRSKVYSAQVSYLEIYNEVGYDLLDPRHEASRLEDLPKVTIMEDEDQNIHLKNLSIQPSTNEEEALNLLFLGDTNRMIAETPMNQASTRSHCIFTVHVCSREPGSSTLRRSKLHLVDLAGSERVGKTGVGGQLLTEAKYINLSLHFLEQVIIALSERNRSHIPYRNSMMTSVLRDSLGGNCMTTMIATVSVDKRNIDESISTCRFAQRVALIKNEALLNEELDPQLVIIRLKKEIQTLKEELALVTEVQREDELTEEEMQKLGELLKNFLEHPDPDFTLDLGPDMRKIQHCFSLLKVMVRDKFTGVPHALGGDSALTSAPSSRRGSPRPEEGSDEEAKKLREMLQQRDNEISVLVSMLKKEKKKVQDAAAQLAGVTSGRRISQNDLQLPEAAPSESVTSMDGVPVAGDSPAPYALHRKRGPELSVGGQEAFEIFRKEHENSLVIEDNKALLKLRYVEAKALGEQVNEARGRVNELKRQLEERRSHTSAQGVSEGTAEPDPVEESLCEQIEREKISYKNTFSRLKALKTEIEHLQLLLERAKVKVQKDFSEWWAKETARQQESRPEVTAAGQRSAWTNQLPESSVSTLNRGASQNCETAAKGSPAKEPTTYNRPDPPPAGGVRSDRALGSPAALSSIPLTGDQQTDADILAFVRARHTLLSRTALQSMARIQVTSVKVSWTGLLVLGHFLYLLLGATIFQMLEREAESNNRNHFQLEKLLFLKNYSCLDVAALEKFVKVILDAWENGVNPSGNSTNPSNWDFSSSFFFAGTVVTTIGYGNLSPSTVSGQVFCVFYALCGIPLNLAFLNQLGRCLTLHLGRLERGVVSAGKYKQSMEVLAVSSFLLMGSVLFLVIPPLLFSYVEGWSYGEGFYFAFITLSTIGFGDYVVGTDPEKHYISVYRSLAGMWIVFGLAWLALIFNIGARAMEHLFQLHRPDGPAQGRAEEPEKMEEGAGRRAVQ